MIDLRSDTVTRPTLPMREAMAIADVGDDVYGEDPTVNRLEAMVAERFGKAAAVFVPSGTQSNLVGLMAHCERGDEYIVGDAAHTYRFEGGGAAVLGSIQPQPVAVADDGTLALDAIAAAIKPDDPHYARTRLVCLENTFGGRPLPLDYAPRAAALARAHELGVHLDGARVFNAAVAQGVAVEELARPFDTVSVCFSKGLGAPVGSALVGSKALVDRARRWKKVLGGGWRQAGILAAAALYALEHHVDRLADDHARAARLAERLGAIDELDVVGPHTNMLFATPPADRLDAVVAHLADAGIRVTARGGTMRLVCHLDVDDAAVERVIAAFESYVAPA